ncbi:synaptotagmin-like protein 1 [Menidia menidia]
MIDLSFLTEEEQETIRAVLKRDAELKKAEEQRVQNLQRTATDRNRLRYLTGEWFYETKQRRHRDRIHGSDLIRASMRHTYRPLTIMELSHILPERSSFVSSENKEVFVPPVLCGLLQEPDRNLSGHRNRVLSPDESGLQSPKAAFRSPSKQRKNPFDWEEGRFPEEAPRAPETAPPSGSHVPPVTNLKQDFNDNSVSQDASVPNVQNPEGTQSWDLSGTVEVPQGPSNQASETWRGAEGGPEEERPTWKTEENPPGAEAGPHQSVGGYEERSSPVVSALRRLASRSKSSSKSLENLTTKTASPVSCSKLMKSCNSVPLLQQNETDGAFEDSLGRRRNNSSSVSNMTLSSGMASMSSVSSSSSSLCPPEPEGGGAGQHPDGPQLHPQPQGAAAVRGAGPGPGGGPREEGGGWRDDRRRSGCRYVKCYLLPDKRKLGKRKTSVKKRTLNPTYNEVLRFPVGLEELRFLRLNASVWHHDPFGRNRFLGQMDLDLELWDLSNTQIHEYPLTARESEPVAPPSGGRMRVALRFLSQSPGSSLMGELQIWVKDCKNLPAARGDVINPFVKCTVLPDMSSRSRQKTRVVRRSHSPMFNHIMVYDGLQAPDLHQACVEVSVWDQDRLQNHYLGGVRLGPGTGRSYGVEVVWMDSGPGESGLWQRMLQSDGEWVEEELPLRQLVTARSMSK